MQHGYAATIHKTQGKSAEQNFVLGDDSVFRELAYSAASRHRETCVFYVVAGRDTALDLHRPDGPADPMAEFERAVARSRSKSLAVDTGGDHADLAAMSLHQLHAERAAIKPCRRARGIVLAPQTAQDLDRRRDAASAKVAQLETDAGAAGQAREVRRELVALDRARPALTARVAQLDSYEAALRPMVERRAALDDAIDRRLGRVLRSRRSPPTVLHHRRPRAPARPLARPPALAPGSGGHRVLPPDLGCAGRQRRRPAPRARPRAGAAFGNPTGPAGAGGP